MSFLYFAFGTMVGILVASSVFFTFCFDGGHNKQDKLIATLEEALYLAAISYFGSLNDCRVCRYGYMCEVHDQDNVDVCIETVMEGWKDEARRVIK